MATLYDLLKMMIEKGASDLHITTGSPPRLRIDGKLVSVDHASLTPADTKATCYSILTDAQKHKFEENSELDLSFGVKGLSRFRANIFMQRGAVAGAFRTIPFEIRSFKELGVPEIVNELVRKPRGLILVTGPTGSGKSTTLASMVDKKKRTYHYGRGPDRISSPAQEVPGQPERSECRYGFLQGGPPLCTQAGPRCRPDR
jgi:twitching motility protein PilT